MEFVTSSQTLDCSAAADITGYVPAAAVVERMQRREARYKLRAALRQVTSIKRLRSCGLTLGSDMVVRCKDGVHHFSGVQRKREDGQYFPGMATCASVWACPVCSAKVRFHRAHEVSRAVVSALDQGYNTLFVTCTIPHSAEDRLGVTLNLLTEGRRYVANQPVVKALRREAGYLGSIVAKEITYGVHGWHPHVHQVEVYEHEITLADFAALNSVYYDYLSRFYSRNGFDGLSLSHGVRVDHVQLGGEALARYVAKLQEGVAIRLHTAYEVTRSDLKQGRAGSVMPFDIAASFFGTGDMALLDLWHEYEQQSKSKSALRFTEGLRARLLPDEPEEPNEKLVEKKIGGVEVVRIAGWFYRKIARIPGLEGKILTALDTGGVTALTELLTTYHLNEPDKYCEIAPASDE